MSDIAEIEKPKIPGNYSARTQHRWIPAAEGVAAEVTCRETDGQVSRSPHEDVDEIHHRISKFHVSPAQMYSTESGRLFHAGAICIVLVGLPARGKTNLSIGLCRYLRWLGVRANLFHFGDYRREQKRLKPRDEDAAEVRMKLRKVVINDMINFYRNEQGQVAIFDGVNGLSSERLELFEQMKQQNVRTIFIESEVDDPLLLRANINDATNSPDYENWDQQSAVDDYTNRINVVSKGYEPMTEKDVTWIRTENFGRTMLVNQLKHDFLMTKIIFYLMNVNIKSGSVYFARCSNNKLRFKSDPPLDDKGCKYMDKLYNTLLEHFREKGEENGFPQDLEVWTSTRLRTKQAAAIFRDAGLAVKPRPEMTQLNPGDAEGLTDEQLREEYPTDYSQHQKDPYHHRYPRAESYHDLALKLEPLILEAGRVNNDVLIIADETVIRVFYGYLMASSSADIPFMRFPQNEIIKISYNAYANTASRIQIPGVLSD
ncbi:DEKNAAC101051 [Brettanomyces naardenensis]|uniref:DEKNAAC101051 n=1 Tax=Brettanomyces naardenensis TaxID=13370 RepID=A0A448YH62_BRENA|nr:DEKNAAC101051 [Brettanomyces naardenensis]